MKGDSGLAIVVERGNPEEASDMAIARQVAAALNRHYPDHLWHIGVQGGGLVLRHSAISQVAAAFLRREGFAFLMPREKMGTPDEISASAVRAGGAMLELFGIPRGRAEYLTPELMVAHGCVRVPAHWKPRQIKGFG